MRSVRVLPLLWVALVLIPASRGDALLLNGGFDTPVPRDDSGADWQAFNIDGSGGWVAGGGSFGEHYILNDAGSALSDPTLEQVLSGLTVGKSYRVVGQFESVYETFGDPEALSFGVEIVGFPIVELMRPTGVGSFGIDFVASQTSHILRLTAERNGDDSSYRVDNVALVPESSALLLLGLAGLALRIRFRR